MSLDVLGSRIIIIRGEDKSPILDMRNSKTGRPIDLTGYTKVTVSFNKSNRSKLILSTEQVAATFARANVGAYTFSAITAGDIGNSIELIFDGIKTIQAVINEWNAANPLNTVRLANGLATDVLSAQTVNFDGGVNSYVPVQVIDAKLGILKVTLSDVNTSSLKLGEGQEFTIAVDLADNRLKGIFRKLDIIEG